MRVFLSFVIVVLCVLFLSLPPEPVQVFKDRQGNRIGASTLMGSTTVSLSLSEEQELRSKGHPIIERVAQDSKMAQDWLLCFQQMPR